MNVLAFANLIFFQHICTSYYVLLTLNTIIVIELKITAIKLLALTFSLIINSIFFVFINLWYYPLGFTLMTFIITGDLRELHSASYLVIFLMICC